MVNLEIAGTPGVLEYSHGVLGSALGRPGCLRLKVLLPFILLCLCGCSWFHRSKPAAPEPPELIVTGVPAGSVLFVDGVQIGQAAQGGGRSRVLDVAAGTHTVEVKTGDTVAYRESTYVGPGDKRVITVLSGNSRD